MARKRRSYHHGNLKRALMDAALALIDEGGLDHFTMAAAGRTAGVSSGAPYRHFPDRRALLATLASEGIEKLDEAMQQSLEEAEDADKFTAMTRCHVGFACDQGPYFRVMNTPEYLEMDTEEAREEAQENVQLLKAAATGKRDALARLGAQAAIYGLARMVVDGHFGEDPADKQQVQDAAEGLLGLFTGR